jgi:formylglycine-generating enzyme required for sulfatase activity
MRASLPRVALLTLALLTCVLPSNAPLRPPVTAPAKKPAEIVVQTSPSAEVYLDDQCTGRPSADGLKYVYIPPGTFMMGCSPGDSECYGDERPAHQVAISKGFWLGQTEVTVGAYKRFAASSRRRMPPAPNFNRGWADQRMPIVNVTWDDAQAYCTWAGGRLPTEAEWEYAARAASTEARYGPLDEIAWYDQNSGHRAHEVGQKRANAWGLFDMLGNVWEWVSDWYDEHYYRNTPSADPQGPGSGTMRVLRGGSWLNYARDGRVSNRVRYDRLLRVEHLGFRCAREVTGP